MTNAICLSIEQGREYNPFDDINLTDIKSAIKELRIGLTVLDITEYNGFYVGEKVSLAYGGEETIQCFCEHPIYETCVVWGTYENGGLRWDRVYALRPLTHGRYEDNYDSREEYDWNNRHKFIPSA